MHIVGIIFNQQYAALYNTSDQALLWVSLD